MYRLRKLLIATFSLAAVSAHAATEINYWLWDALQLPAYQAAAAAFEKANPDIKVKVTQTSWGDYWTTLSTGFVSGTAPDVFVNHLSRYPEFVANELLVDIAPMIKKDNVPTDIYLGGLYELWGKEGKQYGLPKDWDTIALIYNKEMLAKAGVDPKELENLTWNPKDGGTFGQLIAKLSIDEAGNNGLSPNFNPKKVKQYGLLIDGGPDGFGQVEWSHFAVSNGFKFHDGPWAKGFHYDDPKLAETFKWIVEQMNKGFIVPARDSRQLGANGFFAAGKGAMALTGSWMINWYLDNAKFDKGFALLPVGPERPQIDVQRPGRFDLGWQQAPGRGLEVGQVPRLRRRSEDHCRVWRCLPGHQKRRRTGPASHEQEGRRRIALPEGGNRSTG